MLAGGLLVVLLLILAYQFIPSSSTSASTGTGVGTVTTPIAAALHPSARHVAGVVAKKEKAQQSLDPTLQLQQLEVIEQIKYEGSGRNIFVSQAEAVVIPTPLTSGTAGGAADSKIYTAPAAPAQAPIPLKFFGFASHPGDPKKIFLSKGDDVFIAGDGEIVDRRYKVVKISATSVDIQDVVGSGPPQSIPLTQGP